MPQNTVGLHAPAPEVPYGGTVPAVGTVANFLGATNARVLRCGRSVADLDSLAISAGLRSTLTQEAKYPVALKTGWAAGLGVLDAEGVMGAPPARAQE
jgi:hypothetical protein